MIKIPKNSFFRIVLAAAIGAIIWLIYKILGYFILGFFDPVKFNSDNLAGFDHIMLTMICSSIFYYAIFKLFRFLLDKSRNKNNEKNPQAKKKFRFDFLIALCVYAILTVLFFYPILGHLNNSLIGPPEDNLQGMWNIWWGYQVTDNQDVKFSRTEFLFFPDGNTLFYHDFSYVNYLISLILRPLENLVLIYNLLILISFPLAGLSVFLLVKYLTKNFYGALIGGFIFAFSPYHVAHALHHLNLSTIYFIPLFILFYIKAIRNKGRFDFFLAGLFFLLCAISHWNYLIFNIFFIVLSYIYLSIKNKKIFLLSIIVKTSLIVLIPVLILSPIIISMLIIGWDFPDIQANVGGHNKHVADTIGLFLPYENHILGDQTIIKNFRSELSGNPWETTVYLGIAILILIIVFAKKIIINSAKFFSGLIMFLLLSGGSYLHFLGNELPIILPYYFLKSMPFIASARVPARNILIVYIFLAIIMGLIIKYIYSSKSKKSFAVLFLLIFGLVIIDYYTIIKERTKVYLPAGYNKIIQAKSDQKFGIINLPLDNQNLPFNYDTRYMLHQTYHEIPIANGYISRKVGSTLIDRVDLKNIKNQKKQLQGNKIKYIVIHKNLPSAKNIDIKLYKKRYHLIYDDSESMVFEIK